MKTDQKTCSTAKIGPRGEARRRALLDAAFHLFSKKGFDKTTLTDLVEEAGGSRTSLYEYFGDKHGLLKVMLQEQNELFLRELSALRPDPCAEPAEALKYMGMHFIQGLLNEDAMAIFRILIAEQEDLKEIREFFFQEGPETVNQTVAEYLLDLSKGGKIEIACPQETARAFIGMIIGDFFIRQLIIPDKIFTPNELDQRVTGVVRLFLQGVLPRK